MAFLLSRCFASMFVRRFFPVRVNTLRRRVTVEEKNGSLFYFLLFLRLFPVSPNWLLNILSPLAGMRMRFTLWATNCVIRVLGYTGIHKIFPRFFLGVHLLYFFPTVALGLIPYNFLCVQTGCLLSDLSSMDDIITPAMMVRLGGVSVIALTLALIKRRRKAIDW